MKPISIILFIFLTTAFTTRAQTIFRVQFSEPLAVLDFVNNLSGNAPDNSFKTAFNHSAYNKAPYTQWIAAYDSLRINYYYEFTSYPYAQKFGGSTDALLKKQLGKSATISDFKLNALGIIPNTDLFTLATVLEGLLPVYRDLIYQPARDTFERQLKDLSSLVREKNIAAYFDIGKQFYNTSWDSSIPFECYFYPLPQSNGFSATAFINNSVCAIQTDLDDYDLLLSVMMHEIFHILYNEQSLSYKKDIERWFNTNTSKNNRYAYLLLNEALATSLGNGYVYGKLKGTEDTADWYMRKYTNEIAKKIYPVVKEYAAQRKPIDQSFVNHYINAFDDKWRDELDLLMTDRFVVTDDAADFNAINRKYPYRGASRYEENISVATLEKMKATPISKIVIVGKDHKRKLALIKSTLGLKGNWIADQKDFVYTVFLDDNTWLLIVNKVKKRTEELFGMMLNNVNIPPAHFPAPPQTPQL